MENPGKSGKMEKDKLEQKEKQGRGREPDREGEGKARSGGVTRRERLGSAVGQDGVGADGKKDRVTAWGQGQDG